MKGTVVVHENRMIASQWNLNVSQNVAKLRQNLQVYHERLYIVCQEEKSKSRALKNEVQMSINAVRFAILRYNSWKQ